MYMIYHGWFRTLNYVGKHIIRSSYAYVKSVKGLFFFIPLVFTSNASIILL